ncbi:MAG: thermopsin family protease [Candidatus Thermoplasmatota archaeon]|nr:thermopsin family protease [Candidatus Thermoplasmatota archaeon]
MDDFGVGPGPTYYEYNTSTWVGTATFDSLDVNGTAGSFGVTPFLPADGLGITLQQNVVLVFNDGGAPYYYWVQNVAGLTPGGCPPGTQPVFGNGYWEVGVGSCPSDPVSPNHDHVSYIYFINDIYNFSTSAVEGAPFCSGAGVLSDCSTSIHGQGMVYGTAPSGALNVYAEGAPPDLPGNQINLTFPAQVELRVVTAVEHNASGAIPYVVFQYNDGFGWQTYDNVTFPFATDTSTNDFQVNGFAYNPDGAFTNSEFIIGGFGDGTYSALNDTNVTMSMQYWNGHNLQFPSNTYNVAGDTAESVDYAAVPALFNSETGAVGASVRNSTNTKISTLYTSGQVATLIVKTPFSSGSVSYGGQNHSFVGSLYEQTMAPGTYSLDVWNGSRLAWTGTVTLEAGRISTISLLTYDVTFQQTGLPSGTSWSVSLNGTTETSAGSTISFNESSGSYAYAVESSNTSFEAVPSSGTVSVSGAATRVAVNFYQVESSVEFTERGLASGTVWSVTLGSQRETVTTSSIVFSETNGNYGWSVGVPSGYAVSQGSGNVTVSGSGVTVNVTFTAVPPDSYAVTFREANLPSGTSWSVTVSRTHGPSSSTTASSTGTTLVVYEPNGTYGYTVLSSDPAWTAESPRGSVTVKGAPVTVSVTFVETVYSVTFTETGLPSGSSWAVAIGSAEEYSAGGSIGFDEPNGTYSFSVFGPSGYRASPSSGTVTVSGSSVTITVTFASPASPGGPAAGERSRVTEVGVGVHREPRWASDPEATSAAAVVRRV